MVKKDNLKCYTWVLYSCILLFTLQVYGCVKQTQGCEKKQSLDSLIIYEKDSLISGACAYKLKLNLSNSKFGNCISTLNSSYFYIINDTAYFYSQIEGLISFPLLNRKGIYNLTSKKTSEELFVISIDSKLNNIEGGGIEFNLITNRGAQIVGYFMRDSSEYIINNYKKIIISNVSKEIIVDPIDTSKIMIIGDGKIGVLK